MWHTYQQIGQTIVVHIAQARHREAKPSVVHAVRVIVTVDLARAAVAFGHQAVVQTAFIEYCGPRICANRATAVCESIEGRSHDDVAITVAIEIACQTHRISKFGIGVGRFDGVAPNVVGNVVQVNGVFESVDVQNR